MKGKYGCYLEMGVGKKRRQRSVIFGTVIKSMPGSMWRVHWECYDKTSDHKTLTNGGKGNRQFTDAELNALDVGSNHLGGVEQLRQHSDNKSNSFLNISSAPNSQSSFPSTVSANSATPSVTARRPESRNEILDHRACAE